MTPGEPTSDALALRRIAVAARGNPLDPSTSSGTPSGLFRGLAEVGVEAMPLHVGLPRRVERVAGLALAPLEMRRRRDGGRTDLATARGIAMERREVTALHTAVARRRLRRLGAVDGIIQWGTEFRLGPGVPYVTFEDQTLRQALRAYAYPELEGRSTREIDAWLERQHALYAGARACCVTSHWARQSLIDDYGLAPDHVHVVGVGRNRELEAPAARDWSTPRFLFVGVDWERKNGPRLLAAFRRLRAERPDAVLELVGRHPEIDEPGVHTHGQLRLDSAPDRERLAGLFAESTCVVVPSLYEPSAIAHAEAAAAGLPSIGSAAGGSGTIIGDAGVLVDPLSEEELFLALRQLADPDRARELGERGLQRAPLFTWAAVVRRLLGALAGRPVSDL